MFVQLKLEYMNSYKSIKNVRSNIDYSKELNSSKIELFQNNTLRPILKHLNSQINHIVIFHCCKLIPGFKEINETDQKNHIESLLTKNIYLKNILLGCVLGLLDEDELKEYLQNETEINKRIFSLLRKRISDQYIHFL